MSYNEDSEIMKLNACFHEYGSGTKEMKLSCSQGITISLSISTLN